MRDYIGGAQRFAFARLAEVIDRRWNMDPFGTVPRTSKGEYERLFETARKLEFPQIDALEAENGFAIDRAWLDDLALHTQITIKKSTLAYPHGRVLYSLFRRYLEENPRPFTTVLETGTARGFSAICLAKAMEDADVDGHIITIDVLPHNRRFFWNCIDDHEGKKTRAELLQKWRSLTDRIFFLQGDSIFQICRVGLNRVHFAFIDAQHTEKNVLLEYQAVSKLQHGGDMIVFDDVTPGPFDGVVKAVARIEGEDRYTVRRLTISEQRAYAWAFRKDLLGDKKYSVPGMGSLEA